jgi:GNAT superfamily N-acetyltransferase
MSGDVQIKQFELAEREALLSFLPLAYPDEPRKSEPAYWDWHFLENPHVNPDDIPLWIVKSAERIVGQLAAIPIELKVGDERKRAIWVIDLIVDRNFRGQKLGKRLFLAAAESYSTMIALGMNEKSTPILYALNWTPLGGVNRYQRLLYPGHAIAEVANRKPVKEFINLCYAPFRPRSTQLSPTSNVSVREVRKFDASFDALWQNACSQWQCAVVRDSRFLEWQFMRQPGKKFDVLGLYDGERLVGYVVLFFRKAGKGGVPPKASIADLCYDAASSLEVIDELLKAALRLAQERRVGSLVTDVLDVQVEERLRRFGFWRIKASPRFMASTAENQDLIYNASNWFLTRADSDVSIFENSNI